MLRPDGQADAAVRGALGCGANQCLKCWPSIFNHKTEGETSMNKPAVRILVCVLIMLVLSACAQPAAEVTGITVNADNAKYWYVSGAEIDPAGLVITASLADGTATAVPAEACEFVKPAFMPYGEKAVTVRYQGFEAEFPIYTCPTAAETDQYITYTVRKNENGSQVTLTASLVGENRPFVLILPGGGYQTAIYSGQEGCGYAAKVNELGYNAFVLEYSTKMEHPAPLDDVSLAYDIIEQNKDFFGVTMENYAVCGSSAGGHLAATWSTKVVGYEYYGKPRPAAAILAYPVINFTTSGDTRMGLVGESPSPELLYDLSADENLDGDYPPTYIWVFVEDSLANHTELMEQALEAAGVRHTARYFHGGAHGLGLAEGYEAEGWLEEAIAFWQDDAA